MTSAELQTILNTIHNHVDQKAGTIHSVSIKNGDEGPEATVSIDWTAFVDNFSGQEAKPNESLTNPVWSKTVSNITYVAKQPITNPGTKVVPAS